jgi:hypothetical protein
MRTYGYGLGVLLLVVLFRALRETWALSGVPPLALDVPWYVDWALLALATPILAAGLAPQDKRVEGAETDAEWHGSGYASLIVAAFTTAAAAVSIEWLGISQHWALWSGCTVMALGLAFMRALAYSRIRMLLRAAALWSVLCGAAFAGMPWACVTMAVLALVIWISSWLRKLLIPDH